MGPHSSSGGSDLGQPVFPSEPQSPLENHGDNDACFSGCLWEGREILFELN